MLALSRVRIHAVVSALSVAAMWMGLASPAAATVSFPSNFPQLFVASGPGCQDGDSAVMGGGFSEPGIQLNIFCSFTLDLNGQDLALSQVAVLRALTIKDSAGGGSLTVNNSGLGAGIRVVAGTTLTIESGTVMATGGNAGAGIGGFSGGSGGVNAGTVNISGGTVAATGGGNAAGIGGGTDSNGGAVNISGGMVTATGGNNGAGIGGGTRGVSTAVITSGTVTISGGTVTATGGHNGTGIGGGAGAIGATFAITGGLSTEVIATGQTAIGAGTGAPSLFGSLSVAGVLRLPSGELTVPDSPGDEITVASNGRIEGTAADTTAGAQIRGLGSIANAGAITLASSLVSGGTPATTIKNNHHLVSFDTQGGSAAPSDVKVFASSFDAGARTFPPDPTRTGYVFDGWNTAADGTGDAVTASSALPGGSTGTPVSLTAFAQWTAIDSTAPETTTDSGPGTTSGGTATFEFSADESDASFECQLDGPGSSTGTFAACDSPKTYAALADGDYTFSVRATDQSGNTDLTPATKAFSVLAPTTDSDGDGVADDVDQCPDTPGSATYNGCPVPDTDSDGVLDDTDQCPNEPGSATYNGCPAPDSDGDGLADDVDACPNLPGPYDGCPLTDLDNDGVTDDIDQCPNEAGTPSNNGCPEPPADTTPPTVTINQGSAQADPTSTSPFRFAVHFSEVVTGFSDADVSLSGTAGAATVSVTGDSGGTTGQDYVVSVTGMTGPGTVIATVKDAAAKDAANNDSEPSTSTDNTVTYKPVFTGLGASITGTARIGKTLTADAGSPSPTPDSTSYQWFADGKSIKGATETTFKLTDDQVGKRITVRVIAKKSGLPDASDTSDPTSKVSGLKAKKLKLDPDQDSVRVGQKVSPVEISGLSGSEEWTLFFDGNEIKSGHADSKGKAKTSYVVPSTTKGKHILRVEGRYLDRYGTDALTVR